MVTPKVSYLLNLEPDLMEKVNQISDRLSITKRMLIIKSLESHIQYLEQVYLPELDKLENGE